MGNFFEQFEINTFLSLIIRNWIDLSINTSVLYLLITLVLIVFIRILSINNKIIGEKWEYLLNLIYMNFINFLSSTIGSGKEKIKYFPFLISLFTFVLINNLIALIPYSFSTTAQMIICVTLSLSIMVGTTIIGIEKHGFKFINLFVPDLKGGVRVLIPFIFLIEIISYLSRVVSLSIRLCGNLIGGHMILKIISTFGFLLVTKIKVLFFIPILVLLVLFVLESFVAFVQSFVITLLSMLYIKDSLNLH